MERAVEGTSERDQRTSRRFWLALGLAFASLVLALVTLVTREWIELVFRVDPDGGSGALEWLIVVVLVAASAVFGLLARLEWRRLHLATA
jgi:hypothetical protein